MLRILFTFTILCVALTTQAQLQRKADSHARSVDRNLIEIGQPTKLRSAPASPETIKVVSYNIRWRGGEELRELARLLKEDPEIGDASILALQEVDRNRARTANENTAKVLAEQLGIHYAWAAPPKPKTTDEEETGVLLLSRYPLSDITGIVLPHEGPNRRRRVGLGGTVKIGHLSLRVYSVHAETRLPMDKKLGQLEAVLEDLNRYPKDLPAIVMGDLNTWEPGAADKISKLFTSAGFQTPFEGEPTFSRRVLLVPVAFRLDWIWLRNIDPIQAGVDRTISLSDHWPLWVALRIKPVRG